MTTHSSASATKSQGTVSVHRVSENAPVKLTPVATVLHQGGVLLSLTDDFHLHMTSDATLALSELLFEAALRDAEFIDVEEEEADH